MKIGIDSFTLRELHLSPYECLAFAQSHHLDGVQFGEMEELCGDAQGSLSKLQALRSYADERDLFMEVSVSTCNPFLFEQSEEDTLSLITRHIELFAQIRCHELRSYISFNDERYAHPVPWEEHIRNSIAFIQKLRPTLEAHGSRINLENHGDSTFDLLQIVEQVGADICGICFDTANTLVNGEDPLMAAARVAPYTHMSHMKDAIIFLTENGITRQGKAAGQGIIPFREIIALLRRHKPQLRLCLEDHKWLFEFAIFDPEWHKPNTALSALELGQVMKLVQHTEESLKSGILPTVQAYEDIPYIEQMEERIVGGATHLRNIVAEVQRL